jgi:hypothetical protein|tara:strand:- start:3181 stop:3408 length:228 start_codon:yes stop_codon:yes gene_type:complete
MALHGVDISRLTDEQLGEVLEYVWSEARDEERAKVLRRYLRVSDNKLDPIGPDGEVYEEIVSDESGEINVTLQCD